jgi:hypothetical protein
MSSLALSTVAQPPPIAGTRMLQQTDASMIPVQQLKASQHAAQSQGGYASHSLSLTYPPTVYLRNGQRLCDPYP